MDSSEINRLERKSRIIEQELSVERAKLAELSRRRCSLSEEIHRCRQSFSVVAQQLKKLSGANTLGPKELLLRGEIIKEKLQALKSNEQQLQLSYATALQCQSSAVTEVVRLSDTITKIDSTIIESKRARVVMAEVMELDDSVQSSSEVTNGILSSDNAPILSEPVKETSEKGALPDFAGTQSYNQPNGDRYNGETQVKPEPAPAGKFAQLKRFCSAALVNAVSTLQSWDRLGEQGVELNIGVSAGRSVKAKISRAQSGDLKVTLLTDGVMDHQLLWREKRALGEALKSKGYKVAEIRIENSNSQRELR